MTTQAMTDEEIIQRIQEACAYADIAPEVKAVFDLASERITALAEDFGESQSRIAELESERDNWIETARQAHINCDFWEELVMETGRILGGDVYKQDDGGIVDRPLGLKVPEVAQALLARVAKLEEALRPFAEAQFESWWDDDWADFLDLTLDDLRKASEAMEGM